MTSEMEIERALKYMRVKEFGKAIEAFKAFEKRDQHLKAMAATNLSHSSTSWRATSGARTSTRIWRTSTTVQRESAREQGQLSGCQR